MQSHPNHPKRTALVASIPQPENNPMPREIIFQPENNLMPNISAIMLVVLLGIFSLE
jgi:hypothetical protein